MQLVYRILLQSPSLSLYLKLSVTITKRIGKNIQKSDFTE